MEVPNALACLSANLDPRKYDLLGVSPGDDVFLAETFSLLTSKVAELSDFASQIDDRNTMMSIANGVNRVRRVQLLSLTVFWRLLVQHFAISVLPKEQELIPEY